MPREYTDEEVRTMFLKHIHALVNYWERIDERDTKGKLSGLAFSILSFLDDGNIEMPGFAVIPVPHELDKEYCIQHNMNWFAQITDSLDHDIAGGIHEHYHRIG